MKALLRLLFGMDKIQRIQIQDGDCLVFSIRDDAPIEDVEFANKTLRDYFPSQKIIVLWGMRFIGVIGK